MKHCQSVHTTDSVRGRPAWLKKKISSGNRYYELNSMIRERGLNTVCSEACCPNQAECYSSGTSTFMIMGDTCTRNCRFCAVRHKPPQPFDPEEPFVIGQTIREMGLSYAVITSVTRDDLPDGGAGHFCATIHEVRDQNPGIKIEVLVPDFQGDESSIEMIVKAQPDVLNHNVETVPRLYRDVRPQALYERSIHFFRQVKSMDTGMITKSGLMLGLGEEEKEVAATLRDLHAAGCNIVTLGQYLAPSSGHYPVKRYLPPEEFAMWEQKARDIGFGAVVSGAFVRSSYNAASAYHDARAEIG